MIYLGIDPGISGAIASIDADTMDIDIQPMPVIAGKGRTQYDLVEIRNVLELQWRRHGELFVTVEKSQPMPPKMGGAIANYARGMASGWTWLLTGMGISHQLVAPRTWQAEMLRGTSGDTKQRSIQAAQRLFPGVSLRRTERCRKDDSGFSDSLLIAAYGMRIDGKGGG